MDGESMHSNFSQEDLPTSNPFIFAKFMQDALASLPENVHAGVHGAMDGVKGVYHGTKINGQQAEHTKWLHKKIKADAENEWKSMTSMQGCLTAWVQSMPQHLVDHVGHAPSPQGFMDLTGDDTDIPCTDIPHADIPHTHIPCAHIPHANTPCTNIPCTDNEGTCNSPYETLSQNTSMVSLPDLESPQLITCTKNPLNRRLYAPPPTIHDAERAAKGLEDIIRPP
jgi:hypothetical protein